MNIIISPSLLSADFCNLGKEVRDLERAGISWLHLDVMDGAFVPNITFGAPVIAALRRQCKLFFDVHLMIEEPARYLEDFAKAGADLLVVHLETMRHSQKTLQAIHGLGLKAGLAINPGTDFSVCRWLLPDLDMILLMGVNPGFSGQKFIPDTYEKIRACRSYLNEMGCQDLPLQVDGGASLENAAKLVDAGADILVSGSAFFRGGDYKNTREAFEKITAPSLAQRSVNGALRSALEWNNAHANAN